MATAKKKFGIEFEGFKEILQQFRELEADIIPVTTKALEETHAYITPKIHEKMKPSNLPAKGKYSTGQSESQIIDEPFVEWDGYVGKVDIGFSLDETLTPIYLIYGTEKMNAVNGLKNTIYGKKTKEEISKIQEGIFTKELEKVMSGGK